MKGKARLCASVSALATLAWAPAAMAQADTAPAAQQGQTAPSASRGIGTPQETPKPVSPSDLSVSPSANPQDVQAAPEDAGDIVVTGLRRSLESAQALKRNSDGIVDAIVAEDIGKLPDTFASAALARVTGVQVTRGAGEAAGVQIRGLPDISTTYNGREIFTAEGRFVAIQDFPAGTVAALEVYKSGTANLIEGGIGGQVNVRGRRPFDFNGFEVSGSLNGVHWEQSGKPTWNGNLLVSNRWDTGIGEMGLLINVAYVGLNYLDATREQSLVIGTTSATNAPGAGAGIRYPDAQGRFTSNGNRYRPSANAAFQWKPTDELELYLDGLYQGYRSHDENQWMFVPIFGGDAFRLNNLTTREGATNLAQSATVVGANNPDGYYTSASGRTNTYQVGGGAVWRKDRLQWSADVAYTDSTYDFKLYNIDYLFASSPTRNVVFESAGQDGGPSFDFVNFNAGDPSNYNVRGFFQEYLKVGGKDIQTRADAQYEFDEGSFIQRLQAGIRYNDRDANRDRGAPYIDRVGNVPTAPFYRDANIPISTLPATVRATRPAFSYNSTFPVYTFAGLSEESIRNNIDDLRTYFGAPEGLPAFNPAENFTANEKALAAYAQAKYGFELGGIGIDGLLGIRAIRTKTRITGFLIDGATNTPVSAENNYTDYLPNASARVRFTDQLQLRANYTQTRTRPNFLDLNPTQTIGAVPNRPASCATLPVTTPINSLPSECRIPRGIGGGNPNLTPLTSDNYDLSLEWYFSRTGSLTGALFRRDAQGFISSTPVDSVDPTLGYTRFTRPENTGQTRFQGAELAFTTFLDFDWLPEWARGFGIQANGTYVDSKGDLATPLAASPNVVGTQPRFSGVSKWAGNLVGLYERPFFSTRLAYNYRSDFVSYYSIEPLDLDANGAARTGAVIEKGRGQLDFSTTVTPIPNITLAFDITNLLGNPIRRTRDFSDQNLTYTRQVFYLERTYSLGVRFRF